MSATSDAIDQALLNSAGTRAQKVAMIIAKAQRVLQPKYPALSFDEVAERLYALVHANRLESAGDITDWRHSEVKLPQ